MGTVPVRVFNYSAQAIGVSARYGGPNGRETAWACAVLPVVGGSVERTENGPQNDPVLSFGSATAQITGQETAAGVFRTENKVTVTKLRILGGKLTADEIQVGLVLEFRENPKKGLALVDVIQKFSNLAINGDDFSTVQFEAAVADDVGKDHGNRKAHLNKHRKPTNVEHHFDKTDHRAFTTLAKDARLTRKTPDYGYKDFPGLGRVYLGEWVESEDRQGIMGLRIVFTEDESLAVKRPADSKPPVQAGEIVIGNQLGGNGMFYP